jgi:NAD(P)-dependent dehydrogenase (short-subunit alcohol dehydrogenase family)
MGEFKDKVVVISGGAGGMGTASAKKFLKDGAIVYLIDINAKALKTAEVKLAGLEGTVKTLLCDVSRIDQIENAVQTVEKNEGRIDVVVNCAGVWVEGPSETMTEQMWNRTVDINLKGTFFMCSRAIPALEKTEGCIVNISSDAGLVGNSEAAIYCASKGGVTLVTRALAVELAPKGIRVNAVCPGDVMSPMLEAQARDYGGGDPEGYFRDLLSNYPQKERSRFATVEEIAEAVYFLASPEVGAITGACLSVDFGITAGY